MRQPGPRPALSADWNGGGRGLEPTDKMAGLSKDQVWLRPNDFPDQIWVMLHSPEARVTLDPEVLSFHVAQPMEFIQEGPVVRKAGCS